MRSVEPSSLFRMSTPLVMFVPAHPPDVVPSISLMAEIALLDPGMLLARHLLRDHLEVTHVMTGRSLMALRALGRTGRRVFEAGHIPRHRRMAGIALLTEQVAVRTAVAVAGEAIERAQVSGRVTRQWRKPGRRLVHKPRAPNCDQSIVVHAGRTDFTQMLDVACRTGLNGRVKGRRFAGERRSVGRMT